MEDLKKLIDRIQKLDESTGDSEIKFLNSILSAIVSAGFSSARFYEIVKDPIEGAEVLVLRAYHYSNPKGKSLVGLRIPLHLSTLGVTGLNQDIVLGDAEHSPTSAKEWIKQLYLEKDRWADVPIRDFQGKLYGLLAFSVRLDYELSEDELFYLRQIRNVVAQFESNFRLKQISKLRSSIAEFFRKHEFISLQPDQIAELATNVILPAVGGQACAVFRYEWPTRRLFKAAEELDGPQTQTAILEAYYTGQYLTGAAWEKEDLRHIPNFKSFMEKQPDLVFKESLDFHHRALNGIQSVMYEPFGRRNLRFFVRVINRKEDPSLPLNYIHRDMLTNICAELTEFTDEFANRIVIKEFERIATSGIRHITNFDEPLAICCEALETIGFGKPAILYQGKGSPQFELIHCGDHRLESCVTTKLFVTGESPLLARSADATGTKITRITDHRTASADQFLNSLRAAGAVAAIFVCSTGESGAIVAVRCVYESQSKLSSATKLFQNSSDSDVIVAMLSMVAGVIEGSRSNVSADFAETLVAHFGHEVATPIAKLGSKAIAAVNRAIKILRDTSLAPETIPKLNEAKEEINNQSHRITHQMKSAIALAERSSGSIDVRFEPFGWNNIIDEAWEEALDWRNGMEDRASYRNIRLVKNDAIKVLRSVGDRDLVHGILSNLFKNAVKYSLPRFADFKPIEVKIIGQPQSTVDIIQIENWGIGIPEDKWEVIFQKFIRVERTDRLRAIRGMGLGLYISRLYAQVHRGELFCRYSRPTLDDRTRTRDLEGFETAFELRLPREQLSGVHKVKIKGG
jgi:signal transduction histidine kinase